MRRIFIPDFRTIEDAITFAQVNKPLKTALGDFQNRDAYSQYGEKAKAAAIQCWESAVKGDKPALQTHMKALSRALPTVLFGFVGERR
jgi:hypothetical protein